MRTRDISDAQHRLDTRARDVEDSQHRLDAAQASLRERERAIIAREEALKKREDAFSMFEEDLLRKLETDYHNIVDVIKQISRALNNAQHTLGNRREQVLHYENFIDYPQSGPTGLGKCFTVLTKQNIGRLTQGKADMEAPLPLTVPLAPWVV